MASREEFGLRRPHVLGFHDHSRSPKGVLDTLRRATKSYQDERRTALFRELQRHLEHRRQIFRLVHTPVELFVETAKSVDGPCRATACNEREHYQELNESCHLAAYRLNQAAPRSGVGLNELLGRIFSAISMPPSGLRVEPEDP